MKQIFKTICGLFLLGVGFLSLSFQNKFLNVKESNAASTVNTFSHVYVRGPKASEMYLLLQFNDSDYPSSATKASLSSVVTATGANFLDNTFLYFNDDTNSTLRDLLVDDELYFSVWGETHSLRIRIDILSFASLGGVTNIVFDEECLFPRFSSNDTYKLDSLTVASSPKKLADFLYSYSIKSAKSELDNIGISDFYTENIDGSKNELITLKFINDTDFKGLGKYKIDSSSFDCFSNFNDYVELYDKNGLKITNTIVEAYFNYTEDNSVSFLINNSANATKVLLKKGLVIPSYNFILKNYLSQTYGFYSLDTNYKLVISKDATHMPGSKNRWDIPQCNISYYDEEGKIIEKYSTTAGCNTQYFVENVISKKGYDSKWVVSEPKGLNIVNGCITVPDDECNIIISLLATPRKFTLSFDGITDEMIVTYDSKIGTLPSIPSVEGKIGYWCVDAIKITNETIWNFDENKKASIIYEDLYFTVKYDTCGGEPIDSVEVLYNTSLTVVPTPIKEGFSFDGWFYDSEYAVKFNAEDKITDNVTLYSKWIVVYTVTFDSNGGSFIEAIKVNDGEIIDTVLAPTKEGCEFIGWTLNGQAFDFSAPIKSNITLVAKWKEVNVKHDNTPIVVICVSSAAGGTLLIAALVVILLKKPWLK